MKRTVLLYLGFVSLSILLWSGCLGRPTIARLGPSSTAHAPATR
ncbi:MAG TPA: hypothetical protein VL332_03550 [Candidatus Saccharimonadaceae bacterium]|nr:hypothetical protein [Candidatus Saccharimonadaceae bacterium]